MVETIDNVSIVSGDPFLSGPHRVAVDSDHQLDGRPFSRVVSDGLRPFRDELRHASVTLRSRGTLKEVCDSVKGCSDWAEDFGGKQPDLQ